MVYKKQKNSTEKLDKALTIKLQKCFSLKKDEIQEEIEDILIKQDSPDEVEIRQRETWQFN